MKMFIFGCISFFIWFMLLVKPQNVKPQLQGFENYILGIIETFFYRYF